MQGLFAEPCYQKVQADQLDESHPVIVSVSIISRKEKCHHIEDNTIEVHSDVWCSYSAEYRERSCRYPASA